MKNAINNNKKNIELIGGKAYNLNILKDNNVNVPKYFVISSKMYELYLDKRLDFNYIKKCIDKYCNENFKKGTLFAIRSSANVEDSSNMSYAGQFKTYLNIEQKRIFEYIIKCWDFASQKDNIKMGIIVQEMVKSEVSGVSFTANPEGILNEAVVTAGQGLGNNVVEDKIPTITYYYNLNDDIYYFEKQDGAIELNKSDFKKIINNIRQINKIYKNYMDIEWAISNNKLYILQARPITTIEKNEVIVLDNSNIVESYPNISLPLTQSCAKILYSLTFTEIFKQLLGEKEIKKHEAVFNNILESVNGRIYYRISNWYTFFRFLPFGNRIIKIWQEMLGVTDKKVIYNKEKINFIVKIKLLFKSIFLLKRNNSNMIVVESKYKKAENVYDITRKSKDKYSNLELLSMNNNLALDTTKLAALALVNDMYTFIFTSMIKQLSKNKKYYKDINNYISNISNLQSMKPVEWLNKITRNIRMDEKFYIEFIKINNNTEFYQFIAKYKDNQNVKDIKDYITMYGDRVLEELKLETKTFKTDPILLVKKLTNNTIDNENNKEIDEIKCNFILKWLIKKAITGISQREIARIHRTKTIGIARGIILKIAENLKKTGDLSSKEDIFYLEYKELEDYINNEKINLKKIVEKRKIEYKEFEKIPAYSRIIFGEKIFNKRIHGSTNLNYEETNLLNGTPVSAGIVLGECIIIENIKNIEGNIKDKILVAKTTDPGWAFLIKDAIGIISERGSLLSHTAIICRELGVPMVTNIKNASKILRNGDKVKLDAINGKIEIIGRNNTCV